MGRAFTIREVRKRDRDDLISNFFSYYEELKRNPKLGLGLLPKKPSIKQEHEWFKNMMKLVKRGDEVSSVAIVDGKAVALCNIKRSSMAVSQHVGSLGIAIRDGYRREGIGKALMKDVLARSKNKFEIITLEVFESNKHAIELYKKFGFKEFGKLPNGIKRNGKYTDAVFMSLKL
ncbi:MAG: GNAT family N-acetyltransferase [Candidatus Micrarchaeota archaeon]|nr:GNAT family N-acetyltransferase [Candidatus Micrarchaeota archaeon]